MTFDFPKVETKTPQAVPPQANPGTPEEQDASLPVLALAEIDTHTGRYLLSEIYFDIEPYFVQGYNEKGFLVYVAKKEIIDIIERPQGFRLSYPLVGGLLEWIAHFFF